MFCPKCGKEIQGNAKFCTSCGEKINVAPANNTWAGLAARLIFTDKNTPSQTGRVSIVNSIIFQLIALSILLSVCPSPK